MTRRELREHCFKMLFCADFYPAEETKEQLGCYFEKDHQYLLQKSEAVIGKLSELDGRINEVAQGWKTKRMGKVDLTILRLALFEMLYDQEIPEKVAINEAVELAKKFGQKESPAFINGVLAKLVSGQETG